MYKYSKNYRLDNMKKNIFIILCYLSAFGCHIDANAHNNQLPLKDDNIYSEYKKRITELVKEKYPHYKETDINVHFIHVFDYEGLLTEEDWYTGVFYKKLKLIHKTSIFHGKEYLSDYGILEDSYGGFIASFRANTFYFEGPIDDEQFILNKMKELKIEHLFWLGILISSPIFGVTVDNEIYVFNIHQEEKKVIPMEEFLHNDLHKFRQFLSDEE